eukprot:TRINITY_DN23906_c0_g2_i1.p1 TRINITY_DN23906_c0_g2~~TRINITY_DN23906_c0_g2_i1.p1  ORF type:complete len:126 (-),score=21.25 TRINITY_DN23906_c0_g2_i1:98-475(-)
MALLKKNVSFSFNPQTTTSPAACELVRGALNAGASVVIPLQQKCHILVARRGISDSMLAQAEAWGVQVWDEAKFRSAAKLPGGRSAAIEKAAKRKVTMKIAKRPAASMKAAGQISMVASRRSKAQ